MSILNLVDLFRSADYKTKLIEAFKAFIKDGFETGKLKPIIAKIFDWNEVAQAHKLMEENQNIGKIILTGI